MAEIVSELVDIKTPEGTMPLFIYRPADNAQHPAVVVIQEVFGVNGNIQDIAKRLANEGYVAAAPDLFYRAGKHQIVKYNDMPSVAKMRTGMTDKGVQQDVQAVVDHLRRSSFVGAQGRVGITGYCMGGRVSFMCAAKVKGLNAAAVYYGGGIVPRADQPAPAEPAPITYANEISCPVIGFFGGKDQGIPKTAVDQIESTLKQHGKKIEMHFYPEAQHGFFCDDRGSYNEEAAKDAWQKTLKFFSENLKGASVGAR